MFEVVDKLPPLLQWAVFLGVMIAVVAVWITGSRSSSGDRGEAAEHTAGAADRMAENTRMIEELQAKLLDERFERLRVDLQLVISSMRLAVSAEIAQTAGDIYKRLNQLEGKISSLSMKVAGKSSNETGK